MSDAASAASYEGLPRLVLRIDGVEQVHVLPEGRTSIGRSSENDLPLRESSVSRFHCTILRDDDEVRVHDTMSRNATRLRRKGSDRTKRAEGKRLREGDTVLIGRLEIEYRGPSARSRPSRIAEDPVVGAIALVAREAPPPAGSPAQDGPFLPTQNPPPHGLPSQDPTVVAPALAATPHVPPPESAQPVSASRRAAIHSRAESETPPPPRRRSSSPKRRRDVTAGRQQNNVAAILGIFGFLAVFGLVAVIAFNRSQPDSSPNSDRVAKVEKPSGPSKREAELEALLAQKRREYEQTQRQIEELRGIQASLEQALGRIEERDATTELAQTSQQRLHETREALARLHQREQRLKGDLSQLRIRPAGTDEDQYIASINRRREAMQKGRRGTDPSTDGDGDAFLLDDDEYEARTGRSVGGRSKEEGKTIVAEVAQPVELSKEDYRALVDRLKDTVGNYGLPYAAPADLEPDLSKLLAAKGEAGARGLIEVYEYSQKLALDMGATVKMLRARVDGLLAKAKSDYGGAKGQGSKSKGGGYYKPQHSQYLEQLQRLLELSEKKIQIKREQRVRLEAFQAALSEGFGKLVSVDATRYLAKEFGKNERNPELRRRMLTAFERGRALHAIPAIIKALKAKDTELKESVESTLVAITGVQLGDSRAAWEAWWKENQDGGEG